MLLASLLAGLLLGASPPIGVSAFSETTVPSGVEAWYHITPLAADGLPPVNSYEEDTLHVAVSGGAERARTYLTLDLRDLPADAQVVGGTLTLPVYPTWSVLPETARIQLCAVTDSLQSVQGSLEPPPAADCARSSEAVYVEGPDPHFTADLGPFDALETEGLALMPVEGTDAWHVAFYAKDHPDDRPITATFVTLSPPDDPTPGAEDVPVAPVTPDVGVIEDPAPIAPIDPPPAPPDPGPPAPAIDEVDVVRAAPFEDPVYAYVSWVLLVPLALLLFVTYYARALVVDDEEG